MAKKKQTYADRAKAIMNKYKTRLGEKFDKGDTLALEAMNQELAALQQEQERARVQNLVDNASPEQLSQFSQAFQAQNNQGPDQPGIPQGGPSGLAGGQQAAPPQIAGQSRFQEGGQLLNSLAARQSNQQNQQRSQDFLANRQQLAQRDTMRQQGLAGMKGGFNTTGNAQSIQGLFPQDSIQPIGAPQPQVGNPLPQPNLPQRPVGGESRLSRAGGVFNLKGFATGGNLPMYQGPGEDPNQLSFEQMESIDQGLYEDDPGVQPWMTQQFGATGGTPTQLPGASVYAQGPTAQGPSFGAEFFDERAGQRRQEGREQRQAGRGQRREALGNFIGGIGAPSEAGDPYQTRVPWWGAAAQGIGAVLANKNIDFDKVNAQQITPQEISLGREREGLRRDRDIANSLIRNQGAQVGSKQQAMQNIIQGATGTQRNLGRGLSKSYQTEENINAQFGQQAGMFNAQQRALAARGERENQLINQSRKDARIQGVTGSITGYAKDRLGASQADMMAKIMAPDNYALQYGEGDTRLKRLLGISGPGVMNQTGETDITGDPLDEGPGGGGNQLNPTNNQWVEMFWNMMQNRGQGGQGV